MKKKNRKKIIISVIIIAAVVVCAIVGIFYQKNSRTAQVTPVSELSDSYWGDEVYSSGQIRNDQSQAVYLQQNDTVKEVFVEEGQEVEIGDQLLSIDTTASELNYNMQTLEVEKLKNKITIAQNELKKLKNTKPVSPASSQSEEPVAAALGPEKTGNAYNYVSESAVAYNAADADGSAESPYRYLCTEGAYVTGEMLIKLAEEGACAVFEVHDGNLVSGEPELSWEVDGSMIPIPDAGTKWDIASRTQVTEEEIPVETISGVEETEGYTRSELNEMISEKEQEIKELDLSKRKAELEVEKLKQGNSDGIVYATVKGTVKNIQDKDNLSTDGTPFLEVVGTEGLYVTGQLSELLLDEVEPGQTVQVMAWESGISCEAAITEISDYPASEVSGYGAGNQNVSYYPYTAFIEDTSGLKNGEYVDLTMTLGGDESGDTIYLAKAYVRTENGKSYVYKADENNRLVKQYVETGKTIYGYSVEIKSGLTMEDRIAFPYGKTAKEGIKAVDSDEMM